VSEYGERPRERHRENEDRQTGRHASAAQLVLQVELVGHMLLVGLLQTLDLPHALHQSPACSDTITPLCPHLGTEVGLGIDTTAQLLQLPLQLGRLTCSLTVLDVRRAKGEQERV
jgi:hypothetical protein